MATNENLIPIPGRLHSIATEGHVAGADEIYDDSIGKLQSVINSEQAATNTNLSNNKVDKVTGKGLSTNDYTTDEKNKLSGIETGAQKHVAPTASEVKTALGTGSGTTKYLREDGTWQIPDGGSDTDITYDTTNKKITKTINGTTSDVVTSEKVVEDGGGMNLVEGYYYNKKFYKEAAHTTEITGAGGRIYIDKDTNREYRFDGTKYVLLKSEVDGSFVNEGTFAYRPTAGALDVESGAVGEGGAQIECVKGNTIAWNQLIFNPSYINTSGCSASKGTIQASGNILTYTVSEPSSDFVFTQWAPCTVGHKFYSKININYSSKPDNGTGVFAHWGISTYGISWSTKDIVPNKWYSFRAIKPVNHSNGNIQGRFYTIGMSAGDTIKIKEVAFIDLTLIYGEGNEPTTPEQFEADYQKWFGKPLTYEEYDEGSLRSVEMTGIKTVGFNQYNQATSKANVVAGEEYQITGTYTSISENGATITPDAEGKFTPTTNEVTVVGGGNDTCIHLVHSGDRNGDYEPYWEHTASLPVTQLKGKLNGEGESVVIFPDGMKKAGTAYDEIVKRGNQTVAIKRIGQVEKSTLTDLYFQPVNSRIISNGPNDMRIPTSDRPVPIFCIRYRWDGRFCGGGVYSGCMNNFASGTLIFNITDIYGVTYESEEQFQAAMQGVILYYELATPQEYIIDDIDFPTEYPVDDYGTEEILSDSAKSLAPTLDIRYGLNATDTLRNLPSKYVSAVEEQNFTEAQKERARKNIGADKYKSQIENLQRSVTEIQSNMSYAIDSIVSTFTLEENSSPTFTINNQGAAAQYINHMGGYLFLVKNGKVYAAKRNPSNWGKFADGTVITSAAVDATECMIHVPDCHFLGNGKTLQFGGMTPIDGGHVFASPHWVGAYQMSAGGHSRAGVGSAHSKKMSAFWNDAQAIHQDMGLANYQFHCLINALYQARYGNLNSDYFLSNGSARSSESWEAYRDLAHGMADALGDGTGCVSAVDSANITRYVTKLFGFEDLFGKLDEFRSGIRFYMVGDVRHAVVYDGNVVSDSAEGRDVSGVLSSADGQYITQMVLGEYWDMLPKAVGGGSNTYYCDGTVASTNGTAFRVGGTSEGGAMSGLLSISSGNSYNAALNFIGARLAFYGEPEIVSGSELISML